jgi:threonine dehydratase
MDIIREVLEAESRIRPFIRETPVERSPHLSPDESSPVFLKLENFQLTGSFKIRGAMNRLLGMTDAERSAGVVTASTGNHGAAVAHALAELGHSGVIFVPRGAAPAKLAKIRAYGAEVREHGDDSGLTERFAREYAEREGCLYVSPYNDPLVIGGQGTIGIELHRQLERLDTIYVSLGGGGLISGVAAYLKSRLPELEVVACSPENSAVMFESLRAGRILELESRPTLSDGTAGGVEPGAITFNSCRELIDRHLLVPEERIARALRRFVERHQMLIEGSAAMAIAAYLGEQERQRGRRIAIVLCGGNLEPRTLVDLMAAER